MPWDDNIPKFDLHKHFGGSISCETVLELLQAHRQTKDIAKNINEVRQRMECKSPVATFKDFLDKFTILNNIIWDENAILKSIEQVVKDQAAEKIDYSEISLSIDKYVDTYLWTKVEVIKFIKEAFDVYSKKYGTVCSVILSLKMEGDRDTQTDNARLLNKSSVVDCLGGIDIVGDEQHFSCDFYAPLFKEWQSAGKVVLAHAGEAVSIDAGKQNVINCIRHMHVNRIRHGLAAANDIGILYEAIDNDVAFDVSLHSNWLANTTPDMNKHPLSMMLKSGVEVSLGTDDPVIFCCNLDQEYEFGLKLGLIDDYWRKIMRTTAINVAGSDANQVRMSYSHWLLGRT